MSDFINTVDILGEEETFARLVQRTITEYNDDRIEKIGNYPFYKNEALTSVNFPNVKSIGGAFWLCKKLTSVKLPNVTSIGGSAFAECANLTRVIIGTTQTTVATLAWNSFNNSSIAKGTGYIYVPDNLVDSYKSANYWSDYASQIKGISELTTE